MTDITDAVARAIDAECAKAGFKLQPHALDSFTQAAIAAMQPQIEAQREDAARRALGAARGAVVELEIAAQDEAMRDYVGAFRDAGCSIRAIDPAQFRRRADGQ